MRMLNLNQATILLILAAVLFILNPKGTNMGNNLNFLKDTVEQSTKSKGNTLDFLQPSEEKPVPSMKEKIFNTIETVFDRDDKTEEALGSTSVETTLRPKARPVVEAVEPEPSASFEGVSKRLVSDLMSDFGLTQVQAVALAGNLAYESANFQTMQEILDKKRQGRGDRGGLGYAQWTDTSKKNNRRTQFEDFAKQNNLSTSSYEANYGYLKKELSERIPGSLENMGKNMITRLKNTNDLESAVKVVMAGYLRPRAYVKRKQNPSAYNTLVNKRTDRAKQVQGLL